jgi:hypothetical protein
LHQVKKPEVNTTGFSLILVGKRLLTEVELAQAFDLLAYIPRDTDVRKSLISIQVFCVVTDTVLMPIRSAAQNES